jgi:hypothetical protein
VRLNSNPPGQASTNGICINGSVDSAVLVASTGDIWRLV